MQYSEKLHVYDYEQMGFERPD